MRTGGKEATCNTTYTRESLMQNHTSTVPHARTTCDDICRIGKSVIVAEPDGVGVRNLLGDIHDPKGSRLASQHQRPSPGSQRAHKSNTNLAIRTTQFKVDRAASVGLLHDWSKHVICLRQGDPNVTDIGMNCTVTMDGAETVKQTLTSKRCTQEHDVQRLTRVTHIHQNSQTSCRKQNHLVHVLNAEVSKFQYVCRCQVNIEFHMK